MKIFFALFVFPFWGTLLGWFFNEQPIHRTYFSEYVTPGSTPDWFDLRKEVNLSAAGFADLLMPSLGCPADELRLLKTTTDRNGNKHLRFQQFHKGMPVENAVWVLHENSRGRLTHGNGKGVAGLNLPTTSPSLDEQAALEKALAFLPADRYAWQDTALEASLRLTSGDVSASHFPKGKLTVASPNFDRNPNEYRLAWRFDVYAVSPEIDRRHVFVDAGTGEVFASVSRLTMHTDVPAQGISNYAGTVNFTACQTVNGIHHLHNNAGQHITRTALGTSNLLGDVVSNDAFFENDPAAVDVHWVVQRSLELLQDTFGYDVLPNDSQALGAAVHFLLPQLKPNAWYDGNSLYFQDGNGTNWGAFTSPDIVAHELFHAVTSATAGLLYQSEPGALNEFYSDFFAIWFESIFTPGNANFIMGDLADANPGNGLGVRNHKDPSLLSMPDSFLVDQFWQDLNGCQPSPIGNDWCYIHKHATVGGHAFYLLVEGGKGVSSLGMDVSVNLFFHALTNYLTPTSTYPDLRLAVLKSAQVNYPNDPNVAAQVAKAFYAVLIGDFAPDPDLDALKVLKPSVSENLTAGEPYLIEWETLVTGIDEVKIEYTLNGGATWLPVAAAVSNTGNFAWNVPSVSTTLALVRVRALDNLLQFDVSDSLFAIEDCQPIVGFYLDDATPCEGSSIAVQNAFPDDGFLWEWVLDGNTVSTDPHILNLSSLAVGAHTLTLRAVAMGGVCMGEFSQGMMVLAAPDAEFFLSADDLTLTGSAVSGAGVFKWEWRVNGNLVGGNSPTLTHELAQAGSVEVCLRAFGECDTALICQMMEVAEVPPCESTEDEWEQITYTNSISGFSNIVPEPVSAMADDSSLIWAIAARQLFKINKDDGSFEWFNTSNSELPCQSLNGVAVLSDGKILLGTENEGLIVFDGDSTWQQYLYTGNAGWVPSNSISFLAKDISQNVWIGSDAGLTIWKTDDSKVLVPELGNKEIMSIAPVENGAWVSYHESSSYKVAKVNLQGAIVDNLDLGTYQNATIAGIAIDAEGYLWADTYPNPIRVNISNSSIQVLNGLYLGGLESDHVGRIWVWGSNGLSIYEGITVVKNYPYSTFSGQAINDLLFESEGRSWVSTRSGLFWKEEQGNSWVEWSTSTNPLSPLPNLQLFSISAGTNGAIHVAAGNEVFAIDDNSFFGTSSSCSIGSTSFNGIVTDSEGCNWVSVSSPVPNMVYRVCPTGNCQPINLNPISFPGQSSYQYVMKSNGNHIWLGTEYGLFRYEINSGEWKTWTTANGLLRKRVEAIEVDEQGNTFIANDADSLIQITPDLDFIYHPFQANTNYTTGKQIQAIAAGNNGIIWLGTYPQFIANADWGELIRFNINEGTWDVMDVLGQNFIGGIWDIETTPDDVVWIVYYHKGVVRYVPASESDKWKHFDRCNSGLSSNAVRSVEFGKNNSVWFATDIGFSIFQPSVTASLNPAFSTPTQICALAPTSFTSQTPAAATQSWEINGEPKGTGATFTHTFQTPGDYTVTLIVGNGAGCEDAISHLVHVSPSAAAAQPQQTVLACNGEAVTLSVGASGDWNSVVWKDAFGNPPVNQPANEPTLVVENSSIWYATVQDQCGGQATFPFSVYLDDDCVYPGDVNLDNIVNQYDLIALAYAFGFTGLARPNASPLWFGQPAPAWQGVLPTNDNVNLKHADCNGDGVVDENDIEIIVANWGLTHGNPNLTSPPVGGAHLTAKIVKLPTLDDSLMQVEFYLVNGQNLPFNTLQGIGFTLTYPPVLGDSAVVITPVSFDLDSCSLGEDGKNLAARWQFYPAQGRIEWGGTRLDHQNRDSVSLLGTLNCIVIVDIDHTGDTLTFNMNFDGTQIVTAAGQFVPVGDGEQTFGFYFPPPDSTSGGDEVRLEPQFVEVFPNPHAEVFTARFLQSHFAAPVLLTLTDVLGRAVWKNELLTVSPGFEKRIETVGLPAGMYFLQVQTPTGKRTFEVVKK